MQTLANGYGRIEAQKRSKWQFGSSYGGSYSIDGRGSQGTVTHREGNRGIADESVRPDLGVDVHWQVWGSKEGKNSPMIALMTGPAYIPPMGRGQKAQAGGTARLHPPDRYGSIVDESPREIMLNEETQSIGRLQKERTP